MSELSVIVEAVGNLTLAFVLLAVVLPRLRRNKVWEVIPPTVTVAVFNLTNVLYAVFYGVRRVGGPSWLTYDTALETVVKGVQQGAMFALPATIIIGSYRMFQDNK